MTHKGTCKGLLHVVLTGDAMSKCIRTWIEPSPNFLPILERSETWEDQNLLQEFTSYAIKHSEWFKNYHKFTNIFQDIWHSLTVLASHHQHIWIGETRSLGVKSTGFVGEFGP